jgi:adenylate cyclase
MGPAARRRWRLPIWLVLLLSFGGLATLSTGSVAVYSYFTAYRTTVEVLRDLGARELASIEQAVDDALSPALQDVAYLADYMARSQVAPTDERRIRDLLMGSMAASRQIQAVAFIRTDLQAITATRRLRGQHYVSDSASGLYRAEFRIALREGSLAKSPIWGTPIVAQGLSVPLLPAIAPVRLDDQVIGVFAAVISLPEVSRQLEARFAIMDATPFVLTDDAFVLAHRTLLGNSEGASEDSSRTQAMPLDPIARIADPVLVRFDPALARGMEGDRTARADFKIQEVEVLGVRHMILIKPITLLGGLKMSVGLHLPAQNIETAFHALNVALLGALGVVFGAVLLALLFGRIIGRPIRAQAQAAERLAALDFLGAAQLGASRFLEIDIAAEAYNRMRSGLDWLSTYVPRALIPYLMNPDSHATFASREADVTVLFTDIVGFSGIAERMSAQRLSAFLNRHFNILGGIIAAEGGSIDKYIGDSVMAFWGAPGAEPDHALHAVRAARDISARLAADNARRRRKGLRPVRIRIGIHSGTALAGNIGASTRINYTLVGDVVNVAQRLEQFAKTIDTGESAATVCLSAETARFLPAEFALERLGSEKLPGRAEPTEIFRLRLS